MESFMSLPEESMTFKWHMEKHGRNYDDLPSNMKTSPSGKVLTISELRKEQEGVLGCSVYTNIGVLVSKKRFLVKEVGKRNVLMQTWLSESRNAISNADAFALNAAIVANTTENATTHATIVPATKRKRSKRDIFTPGDESDEVRENDDDYDIDAFEKENSIRNSDDEGLELKPEDVINDIYQDSGRSRQRTNHRQNLQRKQLQGRKTEVMEAENEPEDIDRKVMEAENEPEDIARKVMEAENESEDADKESKLIIKKGPSKHQGQSISVFLGFEKQLSAPEVRVADQLSKATSKCSRDNQCSIHAICVLSDSNKNGFCRCLQKFHGSGIFCWEDSNIRNSYWSGD